MTKDDAAVIRWWMSNFWWLIHLAWIYAFIVKGYDGMHF